ncbi:histidine phosphatase family protein [Porphyromonas circumdentaria]|uniref:phosphoglycerate mutase (2,3-diphosphoglycerate-dependent) n=1 Tax=Porphyromonas circumdentaria TaxID=29524 RepID=A0A1T4MEK9_9PORP|nr:histidine phosphatase family protein [Porphyromonas circumdentaria]MBB6275795.1 alpha-ribazole phosphatase [Porphyromonas circumdentaria]MDO4721700.1 histidine phosphatase family protein [Porphyromonas circumdentaria]SJZ65208.1 alpha-ribazole phosphatase [Porphyromonas circumdentaria]
MKVSLVRHTSVLLDGNQFCYGATDVDVIPENFEREAEGARKAIVQLQPDAVFTSPLQRAVRLASYCGYPEAQRDDRLKEMNFGDWEGRPWTEILTTEDVPDFFSYYINNPTPNGESLKDQLNRVHHFFEEKKREKHKHILLFCHGGVINCARTLVGETTIEKAFASLPGFASHTLLEF